MIHQLRLTRSSDGTHAVPWASTVPCLKNRAPVAFQPGLNILFGPNGSGKSTVLKLLAMYLAAEQGGRSVATTTWLQELFGFGGSDDAMCWTVEHDGQPVVYSNPRQAIGLYGHGAAFDDDFFSAGLNELSVMKSSSGQTTSARIARVIRMIMEEASQAPSASSDTSGENAVPKAPRRGKRAEDFRRKPPQPPAQDDHRFPTEVEWRLGGMNDVWDARIKIARAMLKGSGAPGPRTLLLDEPETGFGLPWQAGFWGNVMRSNEAAGFQIIVATHSPFALNVPGAHYVETVPGYLDECRAIMGLEFGLGRPHAVPKATP